MRILLIPALVVAGSAQGAEDVPYRPYNLLHTGYTEKQVAPDNWRVKGSAHAIGGGVAVALYRVAELAMAAHADEVRVTSQKVKSMTVTRRIGNDIVSFTETAAVTVRFVRTDADRALCDEQDARACMTLPVAGLLARFGDRVGRPTARPGEAPGAPVAIVTYDPRRGAPAPWQVEAARRWPAPVSIPVRVGSAGVRPDGAMPVAAPPATIQPARLLPAVVRVATPAPVKLSAAEIERARLQAATVDDGNPGQGVTIR